MCGSVRCQERESSRGRKHQPGDAHRSLLSPPFRRFFFPFFLLSFCYFRYFCFISLVILCRSVAVLCPPPSSPPSPTHSPRDRPLKPYPLPLFRPFSRSAVTSQSRWTTTAPYLLLPAPANCLSISNANLHYPQPTPLL